MRKFPKGLGLLSSGLVFFLFSISSSHAELLQVALGKINENHGRIQRAADAFDIHPQVLCAIILTERTLNYDWTDDALDEVAFLKWRKNSSMGFCQIKAKTAYFIERQLQDSSSVFYVGGKYKNILQVSQSPMELSKKLMTDSLNIFYAAAYLKMMLTRWEKAGWRIDRRPDILGTLYSTGLYRSNGSERSPNSNPESNKFGKKVLNNMKFFDTNGKPISPTHLSIMSAVLRKNLIRIPLLVMIILLAVPILVLGVFKWVRPPFSSFMLQKRFQGSDKLRYNWTDFDEISPYVILAIVAAEDLNFPRHHGFDFSQIKRAMIQNKNSEHVVGASTISQQVTKNLFLWPGKSFFRKAIESYLTVFLELVWGKKRILEVYLNVAEMGNGVYGVAAASLLYFNKPQSSLTAEQAVSLSMVLPNPNHNIVNCQSSEHKEKKNRLLQKLRYLENRKYLRGL